MSLQVGVETPKPSAPPLEEPIISVTTPLAVQRDCEAIGDSILESIFNPNCGLDIYETCNEKTWVDCKIAESRLGMYIFGAIIAIVLLIIFFVTDGVGKFVVVLIAFGLFLLFKFGSSMVEKSARTEYQRMNREIEGIMRSGDMTGKEAVMQLRDEKLRRETNAAMRSQPAGTGLTAGLAAGMVSGLINRGKK